MRGLGRRRVSDGPRGGGPRSGTAAAPVGSTRPALYHGGVILRLDLGFYTRSSTPRPLGTRDLRVVPSYFDRFVPTKKMLFLEEKI